MRKIVLVSVVLLLICSSVFALSLNDLTGGGSIGDSILSFFSRFANFFANFFNTGCSEWGESCVSIRCCSGYTCCTECKKCYINCPNCECCDSIDDCSNCGDGRTECKENKCVQPTSGDDCPEEYESTQAYFHTFEIGKEPGPLNNNLEVGVGTRVKGVGVHNQDTYPPAPPPWNDIIVNVKKPDGSDLSECKDKSVECIFTASEVGDYKLIVTSNEGQGERCRAEATLSVKESGRTCPYDSTYARFFVGGKYQDKPTVELKDYYDITHVGETCVARDPANPGKTHEIKCDLCIRASPVYPEDYNKATDDEKNKCCIKNVIRALGYYNGNVNLNNDIHIKVTNPKDPWAGDEVGGDVISGCISSNPKLGHNYECYIVPRAAKTATDTTAGTYTLSVTTEGVDPSVPGCSAEATLTVT